MYARTRERRSRVTPTVQTRLKKTQTSDTWMHLSGWVAQYDTRLLELRDIYVVGIALMKCHRFFSSKILQCQQSGCVALCSVLRPWKLCSFLQQSSTTFSLQQERLLALCTSTSPSFFVFSSPRIRLYERTFQNGIKRLNEKSFTLRWWQRRKFYQRTQEDCTY